MHTVNDIKIIVPKPRKGRDYFDCMQTSICGATIILYYNYAIPACTN